MPDRDRDSDFVRALAPLGDAAVPAAEFYNAAVDQLAAVGQLTADSRAILGKLRLVDKAARSEAAVAAFKLGYAARLSAEAAGAGPAVSRGDLPPLEFGVAGPKPSSVRDRSADILHFAAELARRITELLELPDPVWRGFVRAAAVQLAEGYGRRAGRKVAPEVSSLLIAGYVARVIDQGYGIAPADGASPMPPGA